MPLNDPASNTSPCLRSAWSRRYGVDSIDCHCPSCRARGVPGEEELVLIAVIGPTGSGKTSFVNLASDSSLCVGTGLEPCTTEIQLSDGFVVGGRKVLLIDTPGFDDITQSVADVARMITAFLEMVGCSTLEGLVYLYPISDPGDRVEGTIANIGTFRKICGKLLLTDTIIVTNMWGDDSLDVGEDRERKLGIGIFRSAIDLNTQLVRYGTAVQSSARYIIRHVTRDLAARPPRDWQEFEAARALRDQEEEIQRVFERDICKIQEQTRVKSERRMRTEVERMAALHNEAKRAMETEMRVMQEEAHLEMKRVAARHDEEKKRVETEIAALLHDNETRMKMEADTRRMQEKARLEIIRSHKQTGGDLV